MTEYIKIIYFLISNLFYVLFFSFIYIPLFNDCNVKKKIKKNGKTRLISQPKIVLAYIYFGLLYIIFKCFTYKTILFLISILCIFLLFMIDKFSPKLNEFFYNLNKSVLMIFLWKLLHSVFTILNLLTQPIFLPIINNINNKIKSIKNFITNVANLSLSDNSIDKLKIAEELIKMTDEESKMSDYICKSKSLNDKNKKNQKLNNDKEITISDINTNEIEDISLSNEINKDNCLNETDKQRSSKIDMIKKIDKINDVFNEINTEDIEDITLTITEVKK